MYNISFTNYCSHVSPMGAFSKTLGEGCTFKAVDRQSVLSHLFSIKDFESPHGISIVWSLEAVNQGLTRCRGSVRWKFGGWWETEL